MSTRRGNTKKLGQKHQNITAFKDYKGATVYKKIKALPNEGLCQKCYDTIEWKKKFHKYKPLKQPAVCFDCKQKVVRFAYHTMCQECAEKAGVCAKCRLPKPIYKEFKKPKTIEPEEEEYLYKYALLSLRKKKSLDRQLEKNPELNKYEAIKAYELNDKDSFDDDESEDSNEEGEEKNEKTKSETMKSEMKEKEKSEEEEEDSEEDFDDDESD
ncbi:hypothetical protein EIN_094970 [Entamoeba invadens IP1]|uniref:Uncharacterized protein n=1 Tax=Entamoeba invadens IP1 TaxID=370355 RepID=A0A0A1U041_ENTIV|nr:hypothetical protein EIN_094970 [Entamoeba invadens IP1]ELP87260.1 hypothetical protein EIN_094970 [Entamoeba invadens IP1]|eukprot:XP_004254031.1 hypothetical protein EIN_094970 [Entamoeba invadens IP1]